MSCPDCIYSLERVRRGEFERLCVLVPSIPALHVEKCSRFKRKEVEYDFVVTQPFYSTKSCSSPEIEKKKRGRPKGGKGNALQE